MSTEKTPVKDLAEQVAGAVVGGVAAAAVTALTGKVEHAGTQQGDDAAPVPSPET